MQTWKKTAIATAAVIGMGVVTSAQARDQIRIVGSSTVYPFASYVVEEFGATTDFPTPVIESTGSGGGLKLFCEGAGTNTPDITNASRRIKVSEFERCQENGVTEITEAVIGYDGIVFAQAGENEALNLTREQIHMAVAAKVPQDGKLVDNPYKNWSEIDSSLPDREIVIYGPPTSSGTRDAFEELVMEAASEEIDGYDGEYTNIRQDGVYVPSGENDNLIVQKLAQNTDAFGIFGYSFLEENGDKIQGASIDGVEPEPEKISSGDYPVSRSLYFYIKNAHVGEVPGVQEYADLFMSKKMISRVGYLKDLGLIPLPADMQESYREQVANLEPLQGSDLK
ncbi:PstS family phosphate ABC transporter substrate-binding protein [Arhodomonas sp. AD133]|uniref:PstS family phosphate ABC transporter substrate-binding protein n=1 Tax=Arhodomonas sp. AD133 TaxID=3415009 RepID=UPI003EBD8C08